MATKNIQVVKKGVTSVLDELVCNGVSCDKVYARASEADAWILVFEKGGYTVVSRAINVSAGNWKMNPSTLNDAVATANMLKSGISVPNEKKCIIFPSACFLGQVADVVSGSGIEVGIQRIAPSGGGSYTGQVSAAQAASVGAKWVLVGHNEAREMLKETNEICKEQIQQALQAGLNIMYCIGDTLQERESGRIQEVLTSQIETVLWDLSIENFSKIVIVYEPIWAMGTGKVCGVDAAQEAISFIRNLFPEKYGLEFSENLSILYGGSVNASNIAELIAQSDIDGALAGGVSLKKEFIHVSESIFNK